MRDVYVVGAHTLKFGKYAHKSIKDLTAETFRGVLADAGIDQQQLQSAWFANAAWGLQGYQHCIRGQVALRPLGIDAIPITNVENACAGGSTAFHGAWKDIAGGFCDVSLAIGAEKIFQPNRFAVFASFLAGTDVAEALNEAKRIQATLPPAAKEALPTATTASAGKTKKRARKTLRDRLRDLRDQAVVGVELGEALGYNTVRQLAAFGSGDHSPFMDIYGFAAREHMRKYGSTPEQLAIIASKNHWHSSFNPNAQYQFEVSVESVLNDRPVAWPLTRAMCAPIGDGAASAILMSGDMVKKLGLEERAVKVRASILGSGRARGDDEADIGQRLSKIAYEQAGVSPQDLSCVELHDATAYGELHQTEALGLFAKGEGGAAAERGDTKLGGKIPVNTSGGLLSRGHPIGASGLAQIHELVTQLRGEAGKRQVAGARLGLAENGGGALGQEEAAMCIHILEGRQPA
ncbi:Thiolase family protein [gamma proteobacterium HdN1]|nr:Thiolase family protein [gamma proteobacterium HdN1]